MDLGVHQDASTPLELRAVDSDNESDGEFIGAHNIDPGPRGHSQMKQEVTVTVVPIREATAERYVSKGLFSVTFKTYGKLRR